MKTLLLMALGVMLSAVAVADTPFNTFVPALPAATTPAGTEVIPCVQGGATKKCTTAQIGATNALTGDVATSAGSSVTTIQPGAVTFAKQQTVAGSTFIGNPTASTSNQQAMTPLDASLLAGAPINAWAVATSNITLSGAQTIDGQSIGNGQIILAIGQTTASQNGLWQSAAGAWTRPPNWPSGYVIPSICQITVEIQNGSANGGSRYEFVAGTGPVTIDTTAESWQLLGLGAAPGSTGQLLINNGGLVAASAGITDSATLGTLTLGVNGIGYIVIGSTLTTGNGENIKFQAGPGSSLGNGNGGIVSLLGGVGGTGTTNNGGVANVTGGIPGTTGNGGALNLKSGVGGSTSGASGAVTLASNTATDGAGGSIAITAANGATTTATARAGGSITLTAGTGVSGGANGTINLNGTVNINSAAITPTLSGTTGSIGGGALLAGQCSSGTATVTGATTSMVALTDPQTYPGDGTIWEGTVTSANTVTVKVCAIIALTPTASVYNVRVLQ